ncbi:hypothetical protein IRZ71_05365 [Flavobacterium sp. ANB]|uniref:hypothetical protein n=1 Tax=unclassified Flavobacterium TaxID=196869 RepID=UPI0012B9AB7E|nr:MULTISPECIES: hypothetical protein [unclassified Flavobacterium]MBF4515758.1 hypothetical protein [Flavobacterium sp. ANB]MTD68761.1 hypothetical protein [Flavobacterium sp. LC2016-13]
MKTILYFTAIFSLFLLFSCSDHSKENLNNEASLPDNLLDKVSGLQVLNSSINNKRHTTALLYGNRKTIERIKSDSKKIEKGEKIVWITWNQKSDPNWFGALIPGKLISLEILEFDAEKANPHYQRFEGNPIQIKKDTIGNQHRIQILLQQKIAILPQL